MSRELPPPAASFMRIQPRPAVSAERPLDADAVLSEAADWRRFMVLNQLGGGRMPISGRGAGKAAAFLGGGKRAQARGQPKERPRPMTSSERGIKFRKKQQERQQLLMSSTEKLRQEIARLEALKDLREGSALVASFTEGGAPVKFAMEYFAQFRMGVPLPGGGPEDQALLRQQEIFLKNMMVPDMKFCGEDAIKSIIKQWRFKVVAHSSMRVERMTTQLVSVDNCATVLTEGVIHMRYARKTFEMMYPHVVGNEELIQKLIGRMVHMPFRTKMYFNEDGKLDHFDIEPDLFAGLYDVLRDLKDCELLLGKTRMPKFIVNGPDQITILEPAAEKPNINSTFATSGTTLALEALEAGSAPSQDSGRSQQTHPACMPAAMNLKFILS